ncbi:MULTISPECIES: chlororespiratory reduction 6 domain-containing protein [unclassified Flavobacterium]|uniref:chlororespiratory reduction 6 domain-containing protein n=1 Tax=unclassified Flavobacterium TaxID=196869 RepID=UPI0006ABEC58|nr:MULTISPECIES: chlororespiratory reduction 6 domain-containing protein [unclassified Flavobacterium]KOP36795.1 hypothetical protein AKO67_17830 [Flavobacterium sp. VMW]OWU91085.1 hypothetical protein APR43_09005 [Flavobacterium sp. NLM]
MDEINIERFETIVFIVAKEYIDDFNFVEIQNFCEKLLQEPSKANNKLMLMIDGYDEDPRELCEIEEVREYFSVLDKLFPYWFYFLNRNGDKTQSSLLLLASILVPIKKIEIVSGKKYIEHDVDKFLEFMKNHFYYLEELITKIGLPDNERLIIINDVFKCFQ